MCGGVDDGHTWGEDQGQENTGTGYCPRCGREIDCRTCAKVSHEVREASRAILRHNANRKRREDQE